MYCHICWEKIKFSLERKKNKQKKPHKPLSSDHLKGEPYTNVAALPTHMSHDCYVHDWNVCTSFPVFQHVDAS